MKRPIILALATLAIVFTGPARGQTGSNEAQENLAVDFAKAFNAKDARKAASFYAEDAVLMPPNQPMLKGRANIEEFFGEWMAAGLTILKPESIESVVSGSHAFDVGTGTFILPDGRTEITKHVVVLKRVGHGWKIVYDIWNSSTPPAGSRD